MSFQVETERLLIRDVIEDDIPALVRQFAEPEARHHILSAQADENYNRINLKNAMDWAGQPKRRFYKLSVVLKANETLIGCVTLSYVRPRGFETELGWHYGHQFRGNGYATEAARAALRIGFETCRVSKIFADCFVENTASIRIFEKIGMQPYLDFSLFNVIRGLSYGEYKPTVRYAIAKYQWLNGKM